MLGSNFKQVFVVVDGLDEMDSPERCNLLSVLLPLIEMRKSHSTAIIKLLISSRPLLDLSEQLKSFQQIVLSETSVHHKDDMERYIRSELASRFANSLMLSENQDLLDEVVARLLKEANGM